MPTEMHAGRDVDYAQATRDLFAYMDLRGHRQSWLADRLGVSRARLWNWRDGRRRMDPAYFDAICRVLEVTPERFGWTGKRPRRKAS